MAVASDATASRSFEHAGELILSEAALAPHWTILSEMGGQTQQSQAATTFLEWFNRY